MIPKLFLKKMTKVDLSKYNNNWYHPGAGSLKRALWYFVNAFVFQSYLFPSSVLKGFVLRLFGAKVGKGCNFKPAINIKYPWRLIVGDYCWLGEGCWIDNLTKVEIGNHVCISQGAYLFCGNHNFKKPAFDLMVKQIKIEDGAWVGAKAIVAPGVEMGAHSVLTAGSFATHNLEADSIYQGNPAQKIKRREIES